MGNIKKNLVYGLTIISTNKYRAKKLPLFDSVLWIPFLKLHKNEWLIAFTEENKCKLYYCSFNGTLYKFSETVGHHLKTVMRKEMYQQMEAVPRGGFSSNTKKKAFL